MMSFMKQPVRHNNLIFSQSIRAYHGASAGIAHNNGFSRLTNTNRQWFSFWCDGE